MSEIENKLHTSVSGAINQHTPSYWRLALPALGARYVARYFQKLLAPSSPKIFDALAGLWMFGTTGFFAFRTASDIKNIFTETVAYEFDKKPSEVGVGDLMRSHNKAVIQARDNYFYYNALRVAVNSTFFASFLPGKTFQRFREVDAVDLGVGSNGVYLVSEVLGRGRTFFEQVQSFVASKIDQENALGEDIKAIELIHLYERYAIDNDPKNAFKGHTDGILWKQSQIIFERMAELMNKTYQHKHEGAKENFTLPKFLYLIGHNLIQPRNVEQTLAFIEVSNRYGMSALKQLVGAVNEGVELTAALQPYPLVVPDQAPAEQTTGKFALTNPSRRITERMPVPSASYVEATTKPQNGEQTPLGVVV